MSYIIKYENFELIDIPEAIKASPSIDVNLDLFHSLEHGIYRETQNGFVIISTEVENGSQNKHAIEIVRDSIISFFSKKTHKKPLVAVKESLIYANKELYLQASQNKFLKGTKLSCLIVLIREKQLFYAYAGTSNFFIKKGDELQRITPGKSKTEDDTLSETNYINSSDLNPHLEVSVCQQAYNPASDDYVFICSDEYVKESDAYVNEVMMKNTNIQKIAIDFAKYALTERNLKSRLTYLLLRFDIKGGQHTLAGSFEYLYGNFFGKLIATITSTSVLIGLAIFVFLLIWYLS